MYTIIIADDEETERKALKLLLQKEFPNISVVAMAQNGTELVSFVQQYKPDMAIVDVNMPGINGIDAIDLLVARGSTTRFVVNTAYSEFHYVQKALALKIDAYILKPEKREATIGTIRKLCAAIDDERTSSDSQRQIRELFWRIQPVMESEILFSIFMGEPASSNFETYCDMHAVNFTAGAMVSLIPATSEESALKSQGKNLLRSFLDTALGDSCCYLASLTKNSISLLIFSPDGQTSEQWFSWLTDVLRVTLNKLQGKFQLLMKAGVGGFYDRFEKMPDSYRESLLALKYTSDSGISFYRPKEDTAAAHEQIVELASSLAESAKQGNLKQIEQKLLLIETPITRTYVNLLWDQLRDLFAKNESDAPELHVFFRDIYGALLKDEFTDFAPFLLEKLCQLSALLTAQDYSLTNQYARQALRMIEECYSQDLSLDAISEKIGISPFYLSRLMKQETGRSFVEYLTQVRISEAVRLAENTNLPIREISQRIGYVNPTYFCRVFKKNTGKTIGELREKNRKKFY